MTCFSRIPKEYLHSCVHLHCVTCSSECPHQTRKCRSCVRMALESGQGPACLANTTLRNKIHCSQDVHKTCWRKRCSVLCDHAATLTTVTPRRVTGRATRSRQTTVTNSPVLAFTLTPARASHLRRVIHHRPHHGHGRARTGGGQNEDMLTPTHIAS